MMAPLQKTSRGQRRRNPVEQRCCPRFPFSPAVEAIDIQANRRVMGRLSDIARHRCYMDTISPFAVKAAVTLMITRDNQSFTTQAKVEQLCMLETWLSELGEGKQREPSAPILVLQPDTAKSFDHQTRAVLVEPAKPDFPDGGLSLDCPNCSRAPCCLTSTGVENISNVEDRARLYPA